MKLNSIRWLAGLALVAGVSACNQPPYPDKAITMIVPFSAGGPTDTVARLIAQAMSENLGQQVTVENVAGAGGTTGAWRVAHAEPDGYTVLLHHIGMSTAPSMYRKLSYDPLTDFEPIGLVTDVPMTLIARDDFPPQNFSELVSHIKSHQNKVTYANAGLGAASQLCGMLFMSALNVNMTTVSYKGTGPAMNDMLGHMVDVMCDQTTNTTSQIKAKRVKVYAVTTPTRVPSLPDVPTTAEAGLPNFQVAVWHGIYAPKGTPRNAVNRLSKSLQVALANGNVKTRFAELGTEPVAQDRATPDALRSHLKAEIDKWAPVIKAAEAFAD